MEQKCVRIMKSNIQRGVATAESLSYLQKNSSEETAVEGLSRMPLRISQEKKKVSSLSYVLL